MTPIISAKDKPFNTSPPNINRIVTTKKVVIEVITVRLRVSLRLLLKIRLIRI